MPVRVRARMYGSVLGAIPGMVLVAAIRCSCNAALQFYCYVVTQHRGRAFDGHCRAGHAAQEDLPPPCRPTSGTSRRELSNQEVYQRREQQTEWPASEGSREVRDAQTCNAFTGRQQAGMAGTGRHRPRAGPV